MTEEKDFRVWLVHPDGYKIDGQHVYRGDQLPAPDEEITLTSGERARVTRLEPEDEFPVRAVRLD